MMPANNKPPVIKHTGWISLKVPEPSDLALGLSQNLFIVSDNGYLFETDLKGKIIRKAKFSGTDFEGVYATEKGVFVVDESPRKIFLFDPLSLEVKSTFTIPYSGARNKGFESITYNEVKKSFVLITEHDPLVIFELDSMFRMTNQMEWNFASDISSATWHNGFIWLLSDEDMTIFKCDPVTYTPLNKWKINVINPEGISFDPSGNLLILSDDMARLYFFENPDK